MIRGLGLVDEIWWGRGPAFGLVPERGVFTHQHTVYRVLEAVEAGLREEGFVAIPDVLPPVEVLALAGPDEPTLCLSPF